MDARELMKFMSVIEKLKCNTRHSWTSSYRKESVAEHSFRLGILAYFMKDEFPEIDHAKLILMALFHDLGEAITGDIPAFVKGEGDEKVEENAIHKLLLSLPNPYQEELMELFQEMKEQKTVEAKLYKSLDKLETLLQHNEADISTWLPQEYELNLTYGEPNVRFSSYTNQLKEEIDRDSNRRIVERRKGYIGEKFHVQVIEERNHGEVFFHAENLPGVVIKNTKGVERLLMYKQLEREVLGYLCWEYATIGKGKESSSFYQERKNEMPQVLFEVVAVEEKKNGIPICFSSENAPYTKTEYERWKDILWKSTMDFQLLYEEVQKVQPMEEKEKPIRKTIQEKAEEYYQLAKKETIACLKAFGIEEIDSSFSLMEIRKIGLSFIEQQEEFLQRKIVSFSIDKRDEGETWTMRKLIRRLLEIDRVLARSFYHRISVTKEEKEKWNPFCFFFE